MVRHPLPTPATLGPLRRLPGSVPVLLGARASGPTLESACFAPAGTVPVSLSVTVAVPLPVSVILNGHLRGTGRRPGARGGKPGGHSSSRA